MADRKNTPFTRRQALAWLLNLGWIAPLVVLIRQLVEFLGYQPPASHKVRFALCAPGSLPDLPAYFEAGEIWLHQDTGGYYAVDAMCTHLGCIIALKSDQNYECPCHGSRFASSGDVLRGPATQPLRFLLLELDSAGQLVVDRSQSVDPSFRMSVS